MSILFGAPLHDTSDGYPPMSYFNIDPYEANRNSFRDPSILSSDAHIPLIKKKELPESMIENQSYMNETSMLKEQKYKYQYQNNQDNDIFQINNMNNGRQNIIPTMNPSIKNKDQNNYKQNQFVADNISNQIKKKFNYDAIHEPDNSGCKNIKNKIKIKRKKTNQYYEYSKKTLWNIIYLLIFIIIVLVGKIAYDHKIIRF
jgi:hypothetical protein